MKIGLTGILLLTVLIAAGCPGAGSGDPSPSPPGNIRFADQTRASGVDFRHKGGRSAEKWMPEVLGSGVVIADFDNNGAPDILLVNSGEMFAETRAADAGNKLFINDGKGKFTDKTAEWMLPSPGYGQGAAAGDFDGDGLTDVFLTNYEGDDRLLRNIGGGFEDVTASSGIASDGRWSTSAGFLDMEGDGDLDIYVVRYVEYSKETNIPTYSSGMMTYSTPLLYRPVADKIWRNEGNGRFSDASEAAGITVDPQKGLAIAIGDIDKDGDQDVYVANDTSPNQLWLNDGKGKFEDAARFAGTAYNETGSEEGSMGADFSDLDSNGFQDIAVTNFQDEATSIYSQSGPMLFRELSGPTGISASSRARLKFGIDFFDADNDGDEDLLVANGHIDDTIEKRSASVTFAQANSLYENTGDGKLNDISESAGEALKDAQVSRGLATADLDGDGDLDFVIVNNDGTAQIAFNGTENKGNFAIFLLQANGGNTNAIGARLVAKIGGRTIERQVMGSQSYLSVSDFRIHFGLGDADKIDELTIHWPTGAKQTLRDIAVNKFYYLKEGGKAREFVPGALSVR